MYIIHYSSNKNIGYHPCVKTSTAPGLRPPHFEIPGSAPVMYTVYISTCTRTYSYNMDIVNQVRRDEETVLDEDFTFLFTLNLL